jgi:hypothetical protein
MLWLDDCLEIEPRVAYSCTVFERLPVGTLVKPPCPGEGMRPDFIITPWKITVNISQGARKAPS